MNFNNDVNNMKKLIVENARFMKSFANAEKEFWDDLRKLSDDMLETRLAMGEALILMKKKQQHFEQILEMAASGSSTLEQFEEKYADLNASEENQRDDVKQSAEYKDFEQEIRGNLIPSSEAEIVDTAEAEIMEVVETGDTACSMYDPWTKGLMLNPVRNTNCGHHYDRDSVMSVIDRNMSVRCPVVGCASQIYIQPNHLLADVALQRKIVKHKAEQAAQESLVLSEEDENDED